MKPTRQSSSNRIRLPGAALLGVSVAVSTLASAAETNAPPAAPAPLTQEEMFEGGKEPQPVNWVEFSMGGLITSGNKAQAQQGLQSVAGPYGGISDFHYQRQLDKSTLLTADGRALLNERDYKLDLGLTREKLGYVRFGYSEFRTWYNGDGGFYPPSGAWYPLPGDALSLDRGRIMFETGLRLEKVPNITFKYSHDFREGDKSSTIWGYTHPAGGTLVRGLSPSFYDIDEKRDAFQLDVNHHIKATSFGAGLSYETGSLNNALKITQFPGEAIQQKVTDRQGTSYDMFNVHAFTETWLKQNLMFSTGYSYSDLDNDFSGSRIYGPDFDAPYAPNTQNGFGYYGLHGSSHLRENVIHLNLMSRLSQYLSITPSLRAQIRNLDANSSGTETLSDFTPTPFSADSSRDDFDVRERLDVSYSGVTNWVFNVRGEWTEGQGDLTENGGIGPVNGIGVPPIQRQTDDNRFLQKYSVNIRWYPLRRVAANIGGYYRLSSYDYDHHLDSTPNDSTSPNRYPAYLVAQSIQTYDANVGITLRPWQNVSLITRYEFQSSTYHTKPDPISGLGDAESSDMTSHIISQNVGWTPWSRLSLQAGLNYVLSDTRSPVSDSTSAVLKAQNNYWLMNFFSSLVLDDKTDLNVNFYYYRANDYANNSAFGVPYGPGAEDYGITAAIVRRLSKAVRLNLKYGFYHSLDEPSGGHKDYQAQFVSASVQLRF